MIFSKNYLLSLEELLLIKMLKMSKSFVSIVTTPKFKGLLVPQKLIFNLRFGYFTNKLNKNSLNSFNESQSRPFQSRIIKK